MASKKPKIKFGKRSGNIFNLIHIASNALGDAGLVNVCEKMYSELYKAKSHVDARRIIQKYVKVN